ncbi:hypothetical protein PVAND_015289 [Polypedilum vanderplanki]|uniref:C2H2-type domain-containing protein n=1 Tax=Polypedilum vanderplanki TaxID=319348 RepID=A0A9J6BCC3_POLVA|nr:hypothetical protein PVAND_015289 [Polypedilum vanderplanki]
MNQEINLENLSGKCSFCFEEFKDYTENVKITKEIETKFNELVQCQLISISFSSSICLECFNKFTIAYDFKIQLEANQKLLEKFLNNETKDQFEISNEETEFIVEYLEEVEEDQLEIIPKRTSKSQEKKICPICANYYSANALDDHINRVHSDNYQFYCDLCPNKFKTKRDITSHVQTHLNVESRRRFQCEFCEKIYMKNSTLVHHIKMRHTEDGEKFECECGASFKTQLRLNYHKKITHEKGNYECLECNRIYPSMHNLKIHISHFHREKEPCVFCGKLVAPGSFMKRHMKIHEEASHKCKICEKSFTVRETLLEHCRAVHGLGGSHFCEMCGKKMSSKKVLKRHIERVHEASEKVKCLINECLYMASRKDNMINHIKNHKELDEETKNAHILTVRGMKNMSW